MSSTVKSIIYVLFLILGNAAIMAVLPPDIQYYCGVVYSILIALKAYFDPTATLAKLGMTKGQMLAQMAQKNPINK